MPRGAEWRAQILDVAVVTICVRLANWPVRNVGMTVLVRFAVRARPRGVRSRLRLRSHLRARAGRRFRFVPEADVILASAMAVLTRSTFLIMKRMPGTIRMAPT